MDRWTNFVEAIRPAIKEGCRQLDDLYPYRNPKSHGAAGADATPVQDNIAYRAHCHARWKQARLAGSATDRIALAKEYIEEWGGIRSNGDGKIEGYALQPSSKLIGLGLSGISSWSKLLSIRNPRKYAIYDARVAFSLNAFQAFALERVDFYFSVPATQSTKVRTALPIIKGFCDSETEVVPPEALYRTYLHALRSAKGGHSLERAEMFLYAIMPIWRDRLLAAQASEESPIAA
jgi:hypothetical protein